MSLHTIFSKPFQKEPYNWNGQVCPAAWTVLSHHAVQADLTPLQQAVMYVLNIDTLLITIAIPPHHNPYIDVYWQQIGLFIGSRNNNHMMALWTSDLLVSSVFVVFFSRWHCYSSHHRSQRMCYALLLRLLRAVEAEWEAGEVNKELVGLLFTNIIDPER